MCCNTPFGALLSFPEVMRIRDDAVRRRPFRTRTPCRNSVQTTVPRAVNMTLFWVIQHWPIIAPKCRAFEAAIASFRSCRVYPRRIDRSSSSTMPSMHTLRFAPSTALLPCMRPPLHSHRATLLESQRGKHGPSQAALKEADKEIHTQLAEKTADTPVS